MPKTKDNPRTMSLNHSQKIKATDWALDKWS